MHVIRVSSARPTFGTAIRVSSGSTASRSSYSSCSSATDSRRTTAVPALMSTSPSLASACRASRAGMRLTPYSLGDPVLRQPRPRAKFATQHPLTKCLGDAAGRGFVRHIVLSARTVRCRMQSARPANRVYRSCFVSPCDPDHAVLASFVYRFYFRYTTWSAKRDDLDCLLRRHSRGSAAATVPPDYSSAAASSTVAPNPSRSPIRRPARSVTEVAGASEDDIDDAVRTAHETFRNGDVARPCRSTTARS